MSDRHSKVLTLAGIKFFNVCILSVLILFINNISIISSPIEGFVTIFTDVLLRILIGISVFALCTVFLDIISIREIVYFFVKKLDKEKVAINVGFGQIIELEESETNIIHNINLIIGFIQVIAPSFILYIIIVFGLEIISFEEIMIGNTIITQNAGEFIFNSSLITFSISLFISGLLLVKITQKEKSFK